MFLVIGHSDIAVQLAKWCSERRPTRLIGLASMLQIDDEIGDCEILPLPQPMAVSALPNLTSGEKKYGCGLGFVFSIRVRTVKFISPEA